MTVGMFKGRMLAAALTSAAVICAAGCGAHEWAQRCDALRAATGSTGDTITIPDDHLPPIELGMPIDAVRKELQGRTRIQYEAATGYGGKAAAFEAALEHDPLQHQFTVWSDGVQIVGTSSTIIEAPFYFVFANGLLEKMVGPARWGGPSDALAADKPAFVPRNANAAITFGRLIHGESLTGDQARRLAADVSSRELTTEVRYMEPNPALDVAVGVSDFLSVLMLRGTESSQARRDYVRHVEALRRLDGFLIPLGTSMQEITGRLGDPSDVQETEGFIRWRYVDDFFPLDIVFEDGACVAVLSGWFANLSSSSIEAARGSPVTPAAAAPARTE